MRTTYLATMLGLNVRITSKKCVMVIIFEDGAAILINTDSDRTKIGKNLAVMALSIYLWLSNLFAFGYHNGVTALSLEKHSL